ncbi:hypothetical protein BDQ17DRAFT_1436386 [Cyathus striatus]|nr:hypothetical protein BDQ17DRAFT_1436386 [Cyathus striatus]
MRPSKEVRRWLTFKKQGDVTSHNITRRVSFPLIALHKVVVYYTELIDYHQSGHFIGTLQSPNDALFVSYSHPGGHAHFNVFTSLKKDRPWGSFATGSLVLRGPRTRNALTLLVSARKISDNAGQRDLVLLTCLIFKPDVLDLLPFNF